MKITPLEIRQKTFNTAFRGLDKDEVKAFLLTLSQEWERMQDELRDMKLKLDMAQRDVQKMREVESSLFKTLKTAEDTSTSIVEQANKQAELQLRETEFKCDKLVNEAKTQARSLVEDAYKQAERIITEMQDEVKKLEQEHQTMENYLEGLVRDLRNLATDALEKVEKSKAKPRNATSSIMNRASGAKLPELRLPEELRDTPPGAVRPAQEHVRLSAPAAEKEAPAPASVGRFATDPWPNPAPATDPTPDHNTANPVKTDPTPARNVPETEVEKPKPEMPEKDQPKAPEVEQPKPEVPSKDEPTGPKIEQPTKPMPDTSPDTPAQPELQPPLTQKRQPEPVAADSGKSFFDMLD